LKNCILYEGPSMLDGKPIVALVAGLMRPSANPKVPFPQVYVLPQDVLEGAKREASTCGSCRVREFCYVRNDSIQSVAKSYLRGNYEPRNADHNDFIAANGLRLCAFGDPAALPEPLIDELCELVDPLAPWTFYTEEWRRFPSLSIYGMASVHTLKQKREANRLGWRTFRIVPPCTCTLQVGELGLGIPDPLCPLCGGSGADLKLTRIEHREVLCHAIQSALRPDVLGEGNCADCPYPCDGCAGGHRGPDIYIPAHGNKARKFLAAYTKEI